MANLALIAYSLNNMIGRKLRSMLSVLSVLIGITAIFVLVSFGQGLSSYVNNLADEMGKDKLMIQPRGQGFGGPGLDSNFKLDEDDLEFIKDLNEVSEATGVYMESAEVEFNDEKKYVFAMGMDYDEHKELIMEVFALDLENGQELNGKQMNDAMFGHNYQLKSKVFDKEIRPGDKVLLNGNKTGVMGFYHPLGNPIDDSNVYMGLEAFEKLFDPSSFQFILVRSKPGYEPAKVAESMTYDL